MMGLIYQWSINMPNWNTKTKTKLRGLSPWVNYTDRATTACRRSDCQLLRKKGATWSAWRIPTAVFSVFWTGAATFLSSSSSVVLTRLTQTHYFFLEVKVYWIIDWATIQRLLEGGRNWDSFTICEKKQLLKLQLYVPKNVIQSPYKINNSA
jgi:hypothetical protein